MLGTAQACFEKKSMRRRSFLTNRAPAVNFGDFSSQNVTLALKLISFAKIVERYHKRYLASSENPGVALKNFDAPAVVFRTMRRRPIFH